MPFKVIQYVPTPNPRAVKCVLDSSPAPDGLRSYADAAGAKGDPLAAALFGVPGVTNLLIHDGWITVNRAEGADWQAMKGEIERVLAGAE